VDAAAAEPSAAAGCCTDASTWATKEVQNHLNGVKKTHTSAGGNLKPLYTVSQKKLAPLRQVGINLSK